MESTITTVWFLRVYLSTTWKVRLQQSFSFARTSINILLFFRHDFEKWLPLRGFCWKSLAAAEYISPPFVMRTDVDVDDDVVDDIAIFYYIIFICTSL